MSAGVHDGRPAPNASRAPRRLSAAGWLPSRRSVIGVVQGVDAAQLSAATDRLARAYARIPALDPAVSSSRYFPELRAGVCAVTPGKVDLQSGAPLVWGAPLGRHGLATADEIEAALADPTRARDLSGVFVLVALGDTGIRVVSSAAFVATLRQAGTAFATRATAAALLAGRRVEVNRDAVAEAVVWQASLGTGGDVVAGVAPLEEASVVDIGRGSAPSVSSYWPLAQRLEPGTPTTPQTFRTAVGERMATLATVEDALLGLTGGLDSTLVAASLAERGGSIGTFTMGHPSYPDLRAARAVARALGWGHETIPVTDATGASVYRRGASKVPGGNHVEWLVNHAPWGDGLGQPRDAILGQIQWSRTGVLWVSGHGGEVLRAFYGTPAATGDPAVELGSRLAGWAPDRVRAEFVSMLQDQFAVATAIGRSADALDLLYVRRQFTWMDRPLPLRQVADVHPVFLTSDMVRAMLDAPLEQRANGELIRLAHAQGSVDISRIAADEVTRQTWWGRILRGRWRPYVDDWPILRKVLSALEPDGLLARDVVGEQWWQWATTQAAREPWVRSCLWNAVALESLHRWQ